MGLYVRRLGGRFDETVDGALGAELLAAFKKVIENPLTMLI